MKICFYSPDNWLMELADELKKHCEVLINDYSDTCDAVLGMSESQINRIPKVKNLYLYQWDCYHWRGNPAEWVELMKYAKEIWCPSEETVRNTKERYGIDSICIRTFIPKVTSMPVSRGNYVTQGARRAADVRWDWIERGCADLKIDIKGTYPSSHTKLEYHETLAKSRAVVSTRDECSTGGFCLFEGAQYGKPLLAADCESTMEYFGNEILYFKKHDYEDFKDKLKQVYDMPAQNYKLAVSYTVVRMALAILQRLKEVL